MRMPTLGLRRPAREEAPRRPGYETASRTRPLLLP